MSAIFCFTIVKKVNVQSLSEIVSKAVTVAETSHTFDQFRVYLEEDMAHQVATTLPTLKSVGNHEGSVSLVNFRQVQNWLNEKRTSEERARTIPGHTSYRPPTRLTTNTCIVVIGSRPFGAVMARIHMEEIAVLRLKLIDILEGLCNLHFYTGAKGKASHDDVLISSVKPDAKDHITYNLNWMADQVMRIAERPSHESVMRRLR